MKYKYLFGPVLSRRLGISLGVDLVPFKTCTLNCVYCECGKTNYLTDERKEYVPTNEVIKELDKYLQQKPELDYITYSGSGEPTMHQDIGEITKFIKTNYPQYQVALLTNATLLKVPDVIQAVQKMDLIVPSLDAVSEDIFKKINRPCSNITAQDIISGLLNLNKSFSGQIWLEIFIIQGLNDTPEEINNFKNVLGKIKPERIQLNTLDRPGTEKWVKSAAELRLKEIAKQLGRNTEIVAKFTSQKKMQVLNKEIQAEILEVLKRRPCTETELAKMLGINTKEIQHYLRDLLSHDQITIKEGERGNFYLMQ